MKQEWVLELFFRGLRGEDLSIRNLANEYGVSTKSISRDITDLKAFLADTVNLLKTPNWSIHIKIDATASLWTSS